MIIGEIMHREVWTCREADSLEIPAELMWNHDCGCVPVVDSGGKLVGMVTDRDICMAAYTSGTALGSLPVSRAMSKCVLTCSPSDAIADAEAVMRSNQVRRLPVVEGERIVGIVSLNDLALASAKTVKRGERRIVSQMEVADTLAAICAHRASQPPALAQTL